MTVNIKDKEYLVSGDGDKTIITWDLFSGISLFKIKAHTGKITSLTSTQIDNQAYIVS